VLNHKLKGSGEPFGFGRALLKQSMLGNKVLECRRLLICFTNLVLLADGDRVGPRIAIGHRRKLSCGGGAALRRDLEPGRNSSTPPSAG